MKTAFMFERRLESYRSKTRLGRDCGSASTAKNREKFGDATEHRIDLFWRDEGGLLFLVGSDEFFIDNMDFQWLEEVQAEKFRVEYSVNM